MLDEGKSHDDADEYWSNRAGFYGDLLGDHDPWRYILLSRNGYLYCICIFVKFERKGAKIFLSFLLHSHSITLNLNIILGAENWKLYENPPVEIATLQ